MKIKMMIDDVSYKEKPTGEETAKIQIRLREETATKEITIEDLFDYIGKGYTFVPGVITGGAKNDNWQQQQVLFTDYDYDKNKGIVTPTDAIAKFKEKNINVLGYYETFSSTDDEPSFRLLFLLDKPITEKNKIEFINKTLITFINGDEATKNAARLFYGTDGTKKEVTIVDSAATITLDDVIKLHKRSSNSNHTKNDELTQLVNDFDLLEYIQQNNEISHTSGNITYFKDCSICGHSDCLRYYHDTNSFYCFGSNGCAGGNIIDYLMITELITTKAEAINYFKYDLLGLPKYGLLNYNEDYTTLIKNQLENLSITSPTSIDWINCTMKKDGSIKWEVNCPRLAKYISDNIPYIFAKNKAKSGMLKYFYFDNHYKLLDDDEIKGFIKYFIQPVDAHRTRDLTEILNLLLTEIRNHKLIDEINSDENIINFKNGILNLITGEIEDHSPNHLSTIQLPCNYIKDCIAPSTKYFDNFIDKFTSGNDEVKQFLLQGMGVALSNVRGYRMKQAIFCFGPGNTGKTQLKLLLTYLLGVENCSSIDLKDLEKSFHAIQLLNKRLAGSNDMGSMKISSLEKFKQLTGGDYISDAYKNEGHIDFRFNGLLWLCGNQLPIFGGDKGDHVYERMVIVECKNVIPEEERDKKLLEHLLEEKDYIVSLAINGLQQVIKNGYKYDIPMCCIELNETYRIDNDSFLTFMEECVVDRQKDEVIKDKCTIKIFYDVYREWAKDNNQGYAQTKREVKKLLEKMGKGEVIHTNGGKDYFKHITLTLQAKQDYCRSYGEIDDYDIDINKIIKRAYSDNLADTGINITEDKFDF